MTAKSFIGNGSGLTNLNLSTVPAGSITSDKLAVGSVTSSALASGAVTSAKIAANSVGSTALASGTVTSVKLADGAVTASKLAVGSVGTNNAVQSEWNAWARTHVSAQTQQVYVATAGTARVVTGVQSQLLASALQPASITNLVPYTGAASSVNLGTNSMTAKSFIGNGSGLTNLNFSTFAAGSITSDKLATGAITAPKLATGSVGSSAIATGAVTSVSLADNSVGSSHIIDGAISAADLASGSVGTNKAIMSEWNAWARAQVPAQTQQVYVATAGTATTATTVAGAQSNLIASALQPASTNGWTISSHSNLLTINGNGAALSGIVKTSDTNGWTVSAHDAWITAAQVPAQTQQVYVATAGTAGAVTGVQSQLLTSALQPASITNLVPYTGAASSVDLGTNSLTAKLFIGDGSGLTNLNLSTVASESITSDKLAIGAVTAEKLAVGSVGTNNAVQSEWNAWARAQVPAQTQQVYVATAGTATTAGTVTGAQSNTIACALQPANTNGWTVSAHDAWITAPTATNIAQAVVAPYTNAIATAWQNPASATNWTWTSDGKEITLTGYNFATGGPAVVVPDMLDGLPVRSIIAGVFNSGDPGYIGTAIASVSGGNNITTIGDHAFFDCTNLTTVSLPQVVTIGAATFVYCYQLTTVDLRNATTIGDHSFRYCTNLTSLTFSQNAPAEGSGVFSFIPDNQVTNYVTNPTATGWGTTWNSRPVVRLDMYGNLTGNATTATTVTGAQSNLIASALQPASTNGWTISSHSNLLTINGNGAALSGIVKTSDTNGWTVSAHDAWITAAQVPAQTQQVYVATAGTAGAVTGVQSQLLTSALQPASITNLVPYTGAASSVDLGTNSMTAKLFIGDGSGLTNLNLSTVASESITSDKLAVGAVTAANLSAGSVGSSALAFNAVTTEKLADGAVTGGKIASGVINSEHLAEGSVTVAKLAISSNLNMNGNRVTNLALPANSLPQTQTPRKELPCTLLTTLCFPNINAWPKASLLISQFRSLDLKLQHEQRKSC